MDRRLLRSKGVRPGCGDEGDEKGGWGIGGRRLVAHETVDLDSCSWHNMAMKRRYLILAVGFVAFVGLLLGVLAVVPSMANVMDARYERIQLGMTRAEVEAIIGPLDRAIWTSNGNIVSATIEFNNKNRVVRWYKISMRDDRTTLEKLVDLMPWNKVRSRLPSSI
jgi:hypothetical protein